MTEWSLAAHIFLPIGLGLLGFVEPCAVGGHMVVLGTLNEQSRTSRLTSLLVFMVTRTMAYGVVGIVVVLIGQYFVAGQKAFWLIFGLAYAALGFLYIFGKVGLLMRRIGLHRPSPRGQRNAVLLGVLFGANVPACAAPLLFAVAGSAAGAGDYAAGFITMALFGLALSAPLLLIVAVPRFVRVLEAVGGASQWLHRFIGVILIAVGVWSVWFGLFVDPADWQL